MEENKLDSINKLMTASYAGLSIFEYEVVVELLNAEFYKICKRDKEFYNRYSYLNRVEGDNKMKILYKIVTDYFIKGKGTKDDLISEIFPIINVMNGCKNTEEVKELKKQLLNLYEWYYAGVQLAPANLININWL